MYFCAADKKLTIQRSSSIPQCIKDKQFSKIGKNWENLCLTADISKYFVRRNVWKFESLNSLFENIIHCQTINVKKKFCWLFFATVLGMKVEGSIFAIGWCTTKYRPILYCILINYLYGKRRKDRIAIDNHTSLSWDTLMKTGD